MKTAEKLNSPLLLNNTHAHFAHYTANLLYIFSKY